MSWTVIIPFKGGAACKSRLGSSFNVDSRQRLSRVLFDHVTEVLRRSSLPNIVLLSDRPAPRWHGDFMEDQGRGLNAELTALVHTLRPGPLLVIHADLPLVSVEDVQALIDREGETSVAPDRHGTGTNAIALRHPEAFEFGFGPGSFARHLIAAGPGARVVTRIGLGLDIDTPDDWEAAVSLGFSAECA